METDRPPSRQGDASDSGGGNIVKAWPPASLALDNPDGKELKSQNLSSLLLITCHLVRFILYCFLAAKKASSTKSIWPPPEPPSRVDTSLMPPNLRPARPDLPGRPRSPKEPEYPHSGERQTDEQQTMTQATAGGAGRSVGDTTHGGKFGIGSFCYLVY